MLPTDNIKTEGAARNGLDEQNSTHPNARDCLNLNASIHLARGRLNAEVGSAREGLLEHAFEVFAAVFPYCRVVRDAAQKSLPAQ